MIKDEGAPYVLYGNVMMRNAPRPNAARLYIDFAMSEESQLIGRAAGTVSCVKDWPTRCLLICVKLPIPN